MAKSKRMLTAVSASIVCFLSLIFGIRHLFGDEVVKEYRDGKYEVRIIKEGRMFLGSKDYILELDGPFSTARYPIFIALDFMSDAEYRDYEIASLKLNPSYNIVTIVFVDGVILKYPVFPGAFSREDFTERWDKVYSQEFGIKE